MSTQSNVDQFFVNIDHSRWLHSLQNTMLLPCIGRSRPCTVYHVGPDEETKRGESGIEQVLF